MAWLLRNLQENYNNLRLHYRSWTLFCSMKNRANSGHIYWRSKRHLTHLFTQVNESAVSNNQPILINKKTILFLTSIRKLKGNEKQWRRMNLRRISVGKWTVVECGGQTWKEIVKQMFQFYYSLFVVITWHLYINNLTVSTFVCFVLLCPREKFLKLSP